MELEIRNLPLTPDETCIKLLVRARDFLQHAISHSTGVSEIDPMIAIHGIDNSIEYLIRIVSSQLDYEGVSGRTFPSSDLASMAGELNKFLQKNYNVRLAYVDEIKFLRQVRNLVQHGALSPANDLDRFVEIAKRFFDKTCLSIFGLKATDITPYIIIRNKTLQDGLLKADELIKNKKYLESVVASRNVFENMIFYEEKSSRYSNHPAPALAELPENIRPLRYLLQSFSNEINYLKLGLNQKKHEQFKYICDHIPHEHRADWNGNIVMQRPWSKDDAKYCLNFTLDCIISLESRKFEPLYDIDTNDENKIIDFINGEQIFEFDGGLISTDDEHETRILIVDEQTKTYINQIAIGKEAEWKTEHSTDDTLTTSITRKIITKNISFSLLTNDPERWEVAISFKYLPFSFDRKDYQDGKLISESPSINSSSVEEFVTLYSVTDEIANKVISYRNAAGNIKTEDDLKKIQGITENQLYWLTRFTIV